MTIELVPCASSTSRFLGFILRVVLPQNEKGGVLESLGCDYCIEASDGQSVKHKSLWFLKHRVLDEEGVNNNVYLWYDGQCCLDIMRGTKESKANDEGKAHNLKVSFRFFYVRTWNELHRDVEQCGVHPILCLEYCQYRGTMANEITLGN